MRLGDYDFLKGVTHFGHLKYPWRSYKQVIFINLTAREGVFSLLILDQNAFINWSNNLSFQPYFETGNITEIDEKITIKPPNHDRITIIIIAEEYLAISGMIITKYLDYYTNYGFFSLVIVAVLIFYYLYEKYRKGL